MKAKLLWLAAIPAVLLAQTILHITQQYPLSSPGWLYFDGSSIIAKAEPTPAISVFVLNSPIESFLANCRLPKVYRNGVLLTSETDWPKSSESKADYRVEAIGASLPRVILIGQKSAKGDVWRTECVDAR